MRTAARKGDATYIAQRMAMRIEHWIGDDFLMARDGE